MTHEFTDYIKKINYMSFHMVLNLEHSYFYNKPCWGKYDIPFKESNTVQSMNVSLGHCNFNKIDFLKWDCAMKI